MTTWQKDFCAKGTWMAECGRYINDQAFHMLLYIVSTKLCGYFLWIFSPFYVSQFTENQNLHLGGVSIIIPIKAAFEIEMDKYKFRKIMGIRIGTKLKRPQKSYFLWHWLHWYFKASSLRSERVSVCTFRLCSNSWAIEDRLTSHSSHVKFGIFSPCLKKSSSSQVSSFFLLWARMWSRQYRLLLNVFSGQRGQQFSFEWIQVWDSRNSALSNLS